MISYPRDEFIERQKSFMAHLLLLSVLNNIRDDKSEKDFIADAFKETMKKNFDIDCEFETSPETQNGV